jgi:hypothetical protein
VIPRKSSRINLQRKDITQIQRAKMQRASINDNFPHASLLPVESPTLSDQSVQSSQAVQHD